MHPWLTALTSESHPRLSDERGLAPCRNRGMVGTDNSFGSFSTRPVVPEKPNSTRDETTAPRAPCERLFRAAPFRATRHANQSHATATGGCPRLPSRQLLCTGLSMYCTSVHSTQSSVLATTHVSRDWLSWLLGQTPAASCQTGTANRMRRTTARALEAFWE